MISCHGAANTNLIFLPDNGCLMEINFRKHWQCDPVCDDHYNSNISYDRKCNGKLTYRPYFHKGDYHNLAKFFDKKYVECEIENADIFLDRNPINLKNIYVDADKIINNSVKLFNSN